MKSASSRKYMDFNYGWSINLTYKIGTFLVYFFVKIGQVTLNPLSIIFEF